MAVVVAMLALYALCCWNARSAMNGLVLSVGYAPLPRFEPVKPMTESVLPDSVLLDSL